MTTTEINRRFSELDYRLRRIVVSRCDELPVTFAGKIVIYNSEIFFWNGTAYERMLTEDDIADFITESELAWLTQNIQDGLVNADAPTTLNPFATMQDLLAIGIGTNIFQAANYSALPAANLHNGEFYWVEAAQGTQWLPGSLGGTYYPLGLYYSNGVSWTYTDSPYQATQIEVDAGLNNTKFVTPFTHENASKWSTKQDTLISGTNIKTINSTSLLGSGDIVISGGSGAVDSVNTQTGVVVLDADDISDAATTNKYTTAGDISKLAGIEALAEVNNISDVNATDLTDGGDTTLHTHDGRYYTESETDTLLSGKANSSHTHIIANVTGLQTALDGKVDENIAITGATKTKITYDAKGLVTSGVDATTADIADSLNKRYVTDANLTVIGNTSGTNTGDNAVNSLYSGLVTNATHTGDATGSGALTVVALNGTNLAALGTGVLKNTTATGVPFISKVALTEPATAATLTIANNQTLTVNGSATITNGTHSGTNTGDQTSIVGITGTKAQFDTAVTDGNILYVGDVTTNATHTGDVIGSGALTAQPALITGKSAATVAGGDLVLIADINDSNNLKQVTAQSIADLGGGGGGLTVGREITDTDNLVAGDANKWLTFNAGTAKNITVPSATYVAGDVIYIRQKGVGALSFVQGGGMTLVGELTSDGQHKVISIFFETASLGVVIGGIT